MATYKVPQDVEAEDKLLGPLTFKQFIFFLIAAGAALFAWLMFQIHPALVLLPLPVILIFGGLAVFRREDQPVEQYLLSFFNYLIRPRQRVWNTEGYYEHLVITVPKKQAEPELKQSLAQVHGQLEKLAQIVDTRGWAAKRPDLVLPGEEAPIGNAADDRLFVPADDSQQASDVTQADDIMDDTNPEARQLGTMLEEQREQKREQLVNSLHEQPRQNAGRKDGGKPIKTPHFDPYGPSSQHLRRINPEHSQKKKPEPEEPKKKPATPDNSDILAVSDQLTVSQVQAAVNRRTDRQLQEGEEVKLR